MKTYANYHSKQYIKDYFLILLGVLSASFGLKGFLLSNNFIDGGATGVSLLITEISGIPLSILVFIVNIPFIILAYYVIGKTFAYKTILAILFLSIILAIVSFPVVTNDHLLVAVFGGFFLGAGIGFTIRGGAVIDGTEVLAIFLSRKFGLTIGDVIIVINVFIFSSAAYFLGIEKALYSMITYLAASKTLDFILDGLEEYIGVTIITTKYDVMKYMIIRTMGYGVTIYDQVSGYGSRGESHNSKSIYTIVTRLEVSKLSMEIEKIDPTAFVVMHSVRDIKGGLVKKRYSKHK